MRRANRVGRNDPCPCGSGRKFKRCHLYAPGHQRSRAQVHEKLEPLSFVELARMMERAPVHPLSIATTVVNRFRETVKLMGWTTEDGFHARDAGAAVLAAFYRD